MEKSPHKSLAVWYYEYKDSQIFAILMFFASVAVCLLLLFVFVIPQFKNWFVVNDEVAATKKRIEVLDSNINLIQSQDDTILDDNFITATSAYPPEKPYSEAMQAVLTSAVKSGVSIEEFSFAVGEISSKSATKKNVGLITIQVDVEGDPVGVKRFIQEVTIKLPIAVVESATNTEGEELKTTVSVTFPSKALAEVAYDNSSPITQMSQKNQTLPNLLNTWKEAPIEEVEATESANLPPPF